MKFFALILLLVLQIQVAYAESLYIVGNKSSFKEPLKIDEIRSIYLLKLKNTKAGKKMLPINLPPNSNVRALFSQAVFHKQAMALADYWNRMAFRGINPPIIQSSEKSVLIFVNHVAGAIGYVTTKPKDDLVTVLLEIGINKDISKKSISQAEAAN